MTGENLAGWIGAAAASSLVSGVVAYFTAVATLQTKTAVLEEREDNHYKELTRKMDQLLVEVREIRKDTHT